MNTISKFKWFWAWQDEKEENWLHEMATQGLHLRSVGLPGSYEFEMGEPRNDYYRMDYIVNRKDYQNYLQLFKDAGWDHIGEMGGWQYFRINTEGNAVPEIYTDRASKAQKYQRLMIFLVILFPIFFHLMTQPVDPGRSLADVYMVGKLIMGILMIIYAYAMIMILRRILQLKNQ